MATGDNMRGVIRGMVDARWGGGLCEEKYQTFLRTWTAWGLPDMDQSPPDQVVSAAALILEAMEAAGELATGRRSPMEAARRAFGLPIN